MNLDNEAVNHMIRNGKSIKTFSVAVKLSAYLDENGNVLAARQCMPLLDALYSLVTAGLELQPDEIHPPSLVGIEVSTAVVKSIIATLVRVEPIQDDLLDPPQEPIERKVEGEVKVAIGAHAAAEKILGKLEAQEKMRDATGTRISTNDIMTMDAYVKLVNESPSPNFTKTLLAEAGPDGTHWFTERGKLSALRTPMVASLTASKPVEVEVKVLYVREKLGFAMVEIVGYKNDYSRAMLCHHNSEVELRFDTEQIERDDLVLIQYRKDAVPLKATALCGTHAKASKKTVLTLSKLHISRDEMNKLHAAAHQLGLPFEDILS